MKSKWPIFDNEKLVEDIVKKCECGTKISYLVPLFGAGQCQVVCTMNELRLKHIEIKQH